MEAIQAEVRAECGRKRARSGRAGGRVPAVLYGKKGETVALWIPAAAAQRIHLEDLKELTLEVGGKPEAVRIQEVQLDPLGDAVLHVDFLRA